MLVILVKMLNPSMVGRFSLGLALSAPILMFFNLQLRALQATSVLSRHGADDFLGVRIVTSAAAMLTVLIVSLAMGYGSATLATILAVTLYKCLDSLADGIYGYLQSQERMRRIAFSLLARGILALLFLWAAIVGTKDIVFGALGLGVSSLAVLLTFDLRSGVWPPRFRTDRMSDIARIGVPLGITSLLLVLATNLPRLILERNHGEAAVGFFSALAYPTVAFSILLNALGQAATPRLASYFRLNRAAFWRVLGILGAVPTIAGVTSIVLTQAFGREVLTHMYTAEYVPYLDVFIILLLGGTIWSFASVVGYGATAAGCLRSQAPIAGVTCSVAFLSAIALIPRQGLMGAALTSLIAGLAGLGLYAILLAQRSLSSKAQDVALEAVVGQAS